MSTRHADYRRSNAPKSADPTSTLIAVDRLVRLRQVVEGTFSPVVLPDIADFLASERGKVDYRVTGNTLSDQSGRHQKRLQCIISGWFDVLDAVTLAPSRFELDIKSQLVLVASEDELPPLEDEGDDEDFVVCGPEFDIKAHVQEEILLALPTTTPRNKALPESVLPKTLRTARASGVGVASDQLRESPFAKLRTLKKTT